jgi:hypothetical protein
MLKGVFDTGGGFGCICYGDQYRGDFGKGLPGFGGDGGPLVVRFQPVGAEKVVSLNYQIRERGFRFGGLVDIGFYGLIGIEVVEFLTEIFG